LEEILPLVLMMAFSLSFTILIPVDMLPPGEGQSIHEGFNVFLRQRASGNMGPLSHGLSTAAINFYGMFPSTYDDRNSGLEPRGRTLDISFMFLIVPTRFIKLGLNRPEFANTMAMCDLPPSRN
jgi:hypothetical protein